MESGPRWEGRGTPVSVGLSQTAHAFYSIDAYQEGALTWGFLLQKITDFNDFLYTIFL